MESSIEKYEEKNYVKIFGSEMDENNFAGSLKLLLHVLNDMSQGIKGRQLKQRDFACTNKTNLDRDLPPS